MQLHQLLTPSILKSDKIILITYSSHSVEFIDLHNIKSSVICIIDANSGKHGRVTICNKEILVTGFDILDQLRNSESHNNHIEDPNLQLFGNISDYTFIITDDYFHEVFNKLANHPAFANYKGDIYYYLNKECQTEIEYRRKYKGHHLESIIVFRSGPHMKEYVPGLDFADNAKVLFDYMLKHNYNQKYRLIWVVKNPNDYEPLYRDYENVEFISEPTMDYEIEHYYRTISLAKFFFFTDAYGIGKYARDDQVRVQLWHGCGFKSRLSNISCADRYEYMTVTGPLYAKEHARVFGLRDEQILLTGIPKGDEVIAGIDAASQKCIRDVLHIPMAAGYILWLPTYRKAQSSLKQSNGYELLSEYNLPLVDSYKDLEALNEQLRDDNLILLIKLHPFQENIKNSKDTFSNICFINNEDLLKSGISVNRIMGMTKALISDYSSAAVDYLALNRPIGFITEDIDSYKADRGFIFDAIEEYLPGMLINNSKELAQFINAIALGTDTTYEKRNRLLLKMNCYSDGNNCKRIIKTLGI